MFKGLLYTAVGATLGAIAVQYIHPTILKKIIPFIMLLVLGYVIVSPRIKTPDIKQRLSHDTFYLCFGLSIGFYNGFFGPGTGSFWVVALMFFIGLDIRRAAIEMKPLNLIGNVVSLLWFVLGGHVMYVLGLIMGAGQIVGARISAHLVINKEVKFIRPVFIVIVSIMTIMIFLHGFELIL